MISFQPSDLLARSGSAPCSYSAQVRIPSSNSRGESHHLIGGNWGESHHLIGGNWGESHHLIGGNWGESHPVPLFFWIDTLQNRVSAFFYACFFGFLGVLLTQLAHCLHCIFSVVSAFVCLRRLPLSGARSLTCFFALWLFCFSIECDSC